MVPADTTRRLDRETLDALDRLGKKSGQALRSQVIDSYLETGPKLVRAMRVALAGRDGPALGEAAHTLSGCSGVLGARALSELCGEVAELARRQDLGRCETRLRAVEEEYRQLASELARWPP